MTGDDIRIREAPEAPPAKTPLERIAVSLERIALALERGANRLEQDATVFAEMVEKGRGLSA